MYQAIAVRKLVLLEQQTLLDTQSALLLVRRRKRRNVATSLADHLARVRAGRNRWSTGQHFRPAKAMCGTAALVHSITDLLESQTSNRVIHIQPRGWIAAPCRTGLSSTHISENVGTNMERIKNELRNHLLWLSFCSEPPLADRARHHDQDRAWGVGRVHWLVEHSATSMATLASDHDNGDHRRLIRHATFYTVK